MQTIIIWQDRNREPLARLIAEAERAARCLDDAKTSAARYRARALRDEIAAARTAA